MLFIRSLIFNILFYINLIGLMIVGLPLLVAGRKGILELARIGGGPRSGCSTRFAG